MRQKDLPTSWLKHYYNREMQQKWYFLQLILKMLITLARDDVSNTLWFTRQVMQTRLLGFNLFEVLQCGNSLLEGNEADLLFQWSLFFFFPRVFLRREMEELGRNTAQIRPAKKTNKTLLITKCWLKLEKLNLNSLDRQL